MTTETGSRAKLYERLAIKTKKAFESGKESGAEQLDAALKAAREGMEKAGEFSREEGRELARFLRRDLKLAQEQMEKFGEATKEHLHPKRVASGVLDLASSLLEGAGETLQEWADKAEEALSFHTGEITGPGTLTCTACGTELKMTGTKKIPPCPKCGKTDFRKSY